MRRIIEHIGKKAGSIFSRENGNATIEFVIIFPILMTLLISSVEFGILTMRKVMLESSVDRTIRDLRLGKLLDPTQASVRKEICDRASMIPSCEDRLIIELTPVNTNSWGVLREQTTCVSRDSALNPVVELNPGAAHELVLIRVCAVFDPIFPTSALGTHLVKQETGGYALTASSAFVNEP